MRLAHDNEGDMQRSPQIGLNKGEAQLRSKMRCALAASRNRPSDRLVRRSQIGLPPNSRPA